MIYLTLLCPPQEVRIATAHVWITVLRFRAASVRIHAKIDNAGVGSTHDALTNNVDAVIPVLLILLGVLPSHLFRSWKGVEVVIPPDDFHTMHLMNAFHISHVALETISRYFPPSFKIIRGCTHVRDLRRRLSWDTEENPESGPSATYHARSGSLC
jgi:hypothetical protein